PTPVPPDSAGSVNRAYMTTQVPTLADVFSDPDRLLLGALLAVLLVPVVVLLVPVVAFPAEFFESTFEENRARIESWFRWVPRPRRPDLSYWFQLGIFGFVAAALLMLVVPEVHLDEATLAQAIGFLLAVPLVVVVLEVPGNFYLRWKHRNSTRAEQLWQSAQQQRLEQQWSVPPSALIVAGFLAVLSRLAEFSPPYVYGLIAIYIGAEQALLSLNEEEEGKERGRRTLVGMLCLFAASVIAWSVWSPVGHTFDQEAGGLGWLVADAFLPTFFLLGLETAVFAMMPLTFLKGKEVWRWKPALWVAAFLPVAFVFINVQLAAREEADLALTGTAKAVVLFCAFGLFSLAFWLYFHPGARRWFSHLVSR
ncbi:MAG: FGLLP motif-containing membrane protein, partial [Pseudonocardiaceae bacterium]